jgi:hypothetical protein
MVRSYEEEKRQETAIHSLLYSVVSLQVYYNMIKIYGFDSKVGITSKDKFLKHVRSGYHTDQTYIDMTVYKYPHLGSDVVKHFGFARDLGSEQDEFSRLP